MDQGESRISLLVLSNRCAQSESLKDFLSNPKKTEVDTFFNWWTFEGGLLSELALEAYGRMAKIMNGLYYHERSKHTNKVGNL